MSLQFSIAAKQRKCLWLIAAETLHTLLKPYGRLANEHTTLGLTCQESLCFPGHQTIPITPAYTTSHHIYFAFSCSDVHCRSLVIVPGIHIRPGSQVAPQQIHLSLQHQAAQHTAELRHRQLQGGTCCRQLLHHSFVTSFHGFQQRAATKVIPCIGVGTSRQQERNSSLQMTGSRARQEEHSVQYMQIV